MRIELHVFTAKFQFSSIANGFCRIEILVDVIRVSFVKHLKVLAFGDPLSVVVARMSIAGYSLSKSQP